MHNTYRLAGHTVEIESVYPQVHTLCADYRTDDPPEYVITTTEADIAYERQRSARADKLEGAAVREHAEPYLETLAVYRKLAQLLVQDDMQTGRLIAPMGFVADGSQYCLLAPYAWPAGSAQQRVADWLKVQMATET